MLRTVKCELTKDLVDACVPGGVVTVCGIVNIISTSVLCMFKTQTHSWDIVKVCFDRDRAGLQCPPDMVV